jgi:Tfp pilus assembly protein PilO
MAMLDSPRSKSIAAMFLAVLIGYMVYSGDGISTIGVTGLQARRAQVQALRDSIASLTAQTDSVKRDLAKGSVEDLRKKTEAYRGTLETLRQLVPDKNEVPGLIDAISTRAKVRGAHLAAITPQPVENGPAPFDTYRYQMSVIGHYDEIGEFLADVAGLRRIIVPIDLSLVAAQAAAARALGDTSKAMLEAKFMVKTFVKSVGAEGAPRGK